MVVLGIVPDYVIKVLIVLRFNEIQLEIVGSVWFEAIWYIEDYQRLLNEITRASHVNQTLDTLFTQAKMEVK